MGSVARVQSAAYLGIQAYPVQIEADVAYGLPQFIVVGMPDTSVKESRERVRSAIKNSGYHFPPEKITLNLAPADIKKEGAVFDLAMALGILAASDQIPQEKLANYIFLGELALDGSIRPIQGAVVIASSLKEKKAFVLPAENAQEASLEKEATVYPVRHLKEVVEFLLDQKSLDCISELPPVKNHHQTNEAIDFSEVRGQALAKRAIEIAVAGGHNLLLMGSPGSGKSMLAKRVPTILPPLSFEDSLELTKIYSVSDVSKQKQCLLVNTPPFRSPHHGCSLVALTGGGSWPKPGEVSLAHAGVLFLDEFPEFRRDTLEALRAPLEDGQIHIARAKLQVTYPARVMLIGAMNPCPCGYLSDTQRSCRCTSNQIHKYQSKISGPILDRIDLHVEVAPLPLQKLVNHQPEECSEKIRQRVTQCRQRQSQRYHQHPFSLNAHMRPRDIKSFAAPDSEGRTLIEQAIKELHLSARAYYKILKIARTIADLAEEKRILSPHIAEAIQYRGLDRQWQ